MKIVFVLVCLKNYYWVILPLLNCHLCEQTGMHRQNEARENFQVKVGKKNMQIKLKLV